MNYYVKKEAGIIISAFRRPQDDTEVDGNNKPIPVDSTDADLIAFQNPVKSLDEQKEDFYNSEGLTDIEFIKALMQQELDADSSVLDAYKTKRIAARAKPEFPQ